MPSGICGSDCMHGAVESVSWNGLKPSVGGVDIRPDINFSKRGMNVTKSSKSVNVSGCSLNRVGYAAWGDCSAHV
jgi:hypothetical protein